MLPLATCALNSELIAVRVAAEGFEGAIVTASRNEAVENTCALEAPVTGRAPSVLYCFRISIHELDMSVLYIPGRPL
jgi:hypothetical protein